MKLCDGYGTDGAVATIMFNGLGKPSENIDRFIKLSGVTLITNSGDSIMVPIQRLGSTTYLSEPYSYLLCDFNIDTKINFDDLMIFSFGWLRQDRCCDVGPLLEGSTILEPIPAHDGRVDIEDLLVFANMWEEWSVQELPKVGSGNNVADQNIRHNDTITLSLAAERTYVDVGDTVILSLMLGTQEPISGMWIRIGYEPYKTRFISAQKVGFCDQQSTGMLSMTPYIHPNAGYVELNVAFTKPIVGNKELQKLKFVVQQPGMLNFFIESAEMRNYNNFPLNLSPSVCEQAKVSVVSTDAVPRHFQLLQNNPNPFNQSTIFRFELPQKAKISLHVYNVLGRRVATVLEDCLASGRHELRWDGRSSAGHSLPSGIYFLKLTNGVQTAIRKFSIIR
jgi:hypothetical protein